MRVLVTGGAGFIGTHTVRTLMRAGHSPVVIDNLVETKNEVISSELKIPLIKSSVGNKKVLLEVIYGKHKDLKNTIHENRFIQAVIHFAAYTNARDSFKNPIKYFKNNVYETLNLLEILCNQKLNTKRKKSHPIPIIFSSSCATYGIPENLPIDENCPQNPINPYGKTKLMVEMILKDLAQTYNLKSVILRYFNAAGAAEDGFFGENRKTETHLIPLAINSTLGINKNLKIFGLDHNTFDGSCIRDYVHVEDIAEAHLLALEKLKVELKNKNIINKKFSTIEENCYEYNVGLGMGFSVLQIINKIEDIIGQACPYQVIEKKEGDPNILIASSKKITKELGWKPKFSSIDEMIIHSYNWIKKSKIYKLNNI